MNGPAGVLATLTEDSALAGPAGGSVLQPDKVTTKAKRAMFHGGARDDGRARLKRTRPARIWGQTFSSLTTCDSSPNTLTPL